jgi:sugar O-acyltransferase (sialic acid O-acetyltransferase NeuD family)
MDNNLNILGIGGHSKVVIEIAVNSGINISGLYDDNQNFYGTEYNGISVSGPLSSIESGNAIIAIGNNKVRKNIDDQLKQIKWKTLIHPSAIIANKVEIAEGTVVMAGAIIQPGAKIGRHCIINTGACIDHDCVIDDYVHIAPGVALAGGVKVGEGTLIGVGTSIVPYVTVGKWATIGAGSAVISDIPDYSTAVGVPAIIKKINNESI